MDVFDELEQATHFVSGLWTGRRKKEREKGKKEASSEFEAQPAWRVPLARRGFHGICGSSVGKMLY